MDYFIGLNGHYIGTNLYLLTANKVIPPGPTPPEFRYYLLYNNNQLLASAHDENGIYDHSFLNINGNILKIIEEQSDDNAISVTGMFRNSKTSSLPVSCFNNLLTGHDMFMSCYDLKELPDYSFTNVKDGKMMFYLCNSLSSLGNNKFNNLLSGDYTFEETNLSSIPENSFENLELGCETFAFCKNLKEINTNFNSLDNGFRMFRSCSSLSSLPNESFKNVTSASEMFMNCTNLVSMNNTFDNVSSCSEMFYNCINLTGSIEEFINNRKLDLTRSNTGYHLKCFYNCSSMSDWPRYSATTWCNGGNIEPYDDFISFQGYSGNTLKYNILKSDHLYGNYNSAFKSVWFDTLKLNPTNSIDNAVNTNSMFYDNKELKNLPNNIFNRVMEANKMFHNNTSLTKLPENSFNIVFNANGMFEGCSSLSSLNNNTFNNVTNASGMFASANSLRSIPDNSFNNVTNANRMFYQCSLTSIGNNEFEKVTNGNEMFFGFNNFTKLPKFTNLTSCKRMFYQFNIDCCSLTGSIGEFINNHPNLNTNTAYHLNCFHNCSSMSDWATYSGTTWCNGTNPVSI